MRSSTGMAAMLLLFAGISAVCDAGLCSGEKGSVSRKYDEEQKNQSVITLRTLAVQNGEARRQSRRWRWQWRRRRWWRWLDAA